MSRSYFHDLEDYIIQLAQEEMIGDFMQFIALNLNKNNPLAHSKEFIDKQFYNKSRHNYNILLAREKQSGEIIGIIAFVDSAFYDNASDKNNFVWLTNWLVKKPAYPTVGLSLLDSVFKYAQKINIGTVGNNEIAGAIYKAMRFTTGQLLQFFMVNRQMDCFSLIQNYKESYKTLPGSSACPYDLCIAKPSDLDAIHNDNIIIKTKAYFINKYYKNPFYKYTLYVVRKEGRPQCLLVMRTDSYEGARALRIVDFWGSPDCLRHVHPAFQQLLVEQSAEYVDFYCHGIDPEILMQAGFSQNTMDTNLVVPCYFEPFCPVNVKINFAYKLQGNQHFTVFKGDGDRDFPRIIKKGL